MRCAFSCQRLVRALVSVLLRRLGRHSALLATLPKRALALPAESLLRVVTYGVPLAVLRADVIGPPSAEIALDVLEGVALVQGIRTGDVPDQIRGAHHLVRAIGKTRGREVVVRAVHDVVLERHTAERCRHLRLGPPSSQRLPDFVHDEIDGPAQRRHLALAVVARQVFGGATILIQPVLFSSALHRTPRRESSDRFRWRTLQGRDRYSRSIAKGTAARRHQGRTRAAFPTLHAT